MAGLIIAPINTTDIIIYYMPKYCESGPSEKKKSYIEELHSNEIEFEVVSERADRLDVSCLLGQRSRLSPEATSMFYPVSANTQGSTEE